jgi:hypothetical protein
LDQIGIVHFLNFGYRSRLQQTFELRIVVLTVATAPTRNRPLDSRIHEIAKDA